MKKLLFLCIFFISFTNFAHAQILRGYDSIHHGASICSSLNIHDKNALSHLYFQKAWPAAASPVYLLFAYDKEFQTIYTPEMTVLLDIDGQTFSFTPQIERKTITIYPFVQTEGERAEVVISAEAIAAIENAGQITLTFQGGENSVITVDLPSLTINEWKKVISTKN